MKRRVVITGMGAVTPIGLNVQDFWTSLMNGECGIDRITRFDASRLATQIAAELKGFDPLNYIDKKEVRKIDLFCQYAIAAAQEAIKDSGLNLTTVDHDRVGVITGTGIGGLTTLEEQHTVSMTKGPNRISPFFIPMMIGDISAGRISMIYNFKGPNYSVQSACATASHAIGDAMRLIAHDDADLIVTGGSEAVITPMAIGGFSSMKAMSTRNNEPKRASRPFDAQRDGFVLGEGGGMVILEELGHAIKRGARIYGELGGIGFTADAYHITTPSPGGEGAVRAMRACIKDAGLEMNQIDYINAHGTSTEYNDKNETAAIKTVFGDHAYKMNVSSTKSMTAHLLGAAGAIELIATTLAICHKTVPPTINYENPDPDCDLNYTPNKPVQRELEAAISNTFGFGGHNACLLVKKFHS